MARIPDHEIERLKRRVSVERLVESAGIELRPHGKDRVGRCPFHDDRHPSLSVNLDTGAFRCRVPACGAHGRDVLAFHMARYGLPFAAAAKALGAWSATR